jgi:hypothetical protein
MIGNENAHPADETAAAGVQGAGWFAHIAYDAAIAQGKSAHQARHAYSQVLSEHTAHPRGNRAGDLDDPDHLPPLIFKTEALPQPVMPSGPK